MKYSEYPYERIDLQKFKKEIELMINDFTSAENANKHNNIIQQYMQLCHALKQLYKIVQNSIKLYEVQ